MMPGLYQCGTCKNTYTRVDHLSRHVRSHTQERPYACDLCSARFARADLLKRHVTGHERGGADKRQKRQQSPNRSARVSQACEACAENHLKCEDPKPCRRCQKKQIRCHVRSASSLGDTRDINAAEDLLRLAHEPGNSAPTEDAVISPLPDNALCEHQDRVDPLFEQRQAANLSTADTAMSENYAVNYSNNYAPQHTQPGGNEDTVNSMLVDLPDFLRNMITTIPDILTGTDNSAQQAGTWTPRGMLDFGLGSNLELNDTDISFLDAYSINVPFNLESPHGVTALPVSRVDEGGLPQTGVSLRTEAFRKSIWRFIPVSKDNGASEQHNLSLPSVAHSPETPESRIKIDRRSPIERLTQTSRDQILALVLSTSKPANMTPIVAAFPSLELLDILMQFYLTSPNSSATSWLHIPTLCPNSVRTELLTALIAAGAVLTPDASLRKLGYALQEALRTYIPSRWEEDNSRIRDLQLLQAYILQLEIGLWSGNSRKIELAESFLPPLVTMLRRGGKFRNSSYANTTEGPQGHDQTVEDKWKLWIEQESYVRLVFHAFEQNAQMSMALLATPSISYAELLLPLPAQQDLWFAATANIWENTYVSKITDFNARPTLVDCTNEVDRLSSSGDLMDTQAASLAVLYAHWGLVWEYRQLNNFLRAQSRQALVMASRHQELVQALDHFRISYDESVLDCTATLQLMLEIVSMHLYVSLEDVHLFAGLEGQAEACRVYPSLREWTRTPASRQAVWHAGQVIRAAKNFPHSSIRDFHAIAVYHASLTFWAYGLIRGADDRPLSLKRASQRGQPIWLDGPETTAVQRFIALDRGLPGLNGLQCAKHTASTAFLSNPSAIMELVAEVLQGNHETNSGPRPPLVENLIQLMGGLRKAAKGSITQ